MVTDYQNSSAYPVTTQHEPTMREIIDSCGEGLHSDWKWQHDVLTSRAVLYRKLASGDTEVMRMTYETIFDVRVWFEVQYLTDGEYTRRIHTDALWIPANTIFLSLVRLYDKWAEEEGHRSDFRIELE